MQIDSENSVRLSLTLYVSELKVKIFFEKVNMQNETAQKL